MGFIQFQSLPNLPIFFFIFSVIYLVAYFIVFRNWSPKIRPEASSCLISFFHGTPAAILAVHAILADPARGLSAANTSTQNLVLDYSIAYFLMDLVHYLIFFPSDILFIGHHLATLFVLVTCRHVAAHGAFAVLSLLVLAEVTSFCQNVWTLAGARRSDDKFAAKVYDFLSPYFYTYYSIVRGILAPCFVYQMAVFYLGGSAGELIPMWVCVSWILVVGIALGISISWIWNLWVELHTEKRINWQKNRDDEIVSLSSWCLCFFILVFGYRLESATETLQCNQFPGHNDSSLIRFVILGLSFGCMSLVSRFRVFDVCSNAFVVLDHYQLFPFGPPLVKLLPFKLSISVSP